MECEIFQVLLKVADAVIEADFGILLRGSRGQPGNPSRGLYGKFAGILQVEIRQWVSSVRMLTSLFVRGTCGHVCRTPHGKIGMRKNTEGSSRTP